jgi:hypothetical protein
MNQLSIFFPIIAFLFPLLVVLGLLYLYRWYRGRKGFRSPLTRQLLRPPGQSLRLRIEEISNTLNETLFVVALVPSLISGVILSRGFVSGNVIETFWIVLGAAIWVCFTAYYVRKIFKLLSERRDLRLGLDGELATAEELNQLMRYGYYVFHDFPADHFNIDHVVIGPAGVFAVETKARSKGIMKGKQDAMVIFENSRLKFSNHQESESIQQAKGQSKWLAEFLRKSVGKPVVVKPILVLPGWLVERREKDASIMVINPKEAVQYITLNSKMLDEQTVQQIKYQVEQRCRTIEPYNLL